MRKPKKGAPDNPTKRKASGHAPSKRPGWQTRVYAYHCYLVEGDLPQRAWDTAKAMRTLWNRCVEVHTRFREALFERLGITEGATPTTEQWRAVKEAYHPFYRTRQSTIYRLVGDEGTALGLGWQKWCIRDRFCLTLAGMLDGTKNAPRIHPRLTRVLLTCRAKDGNAPLAWLDQAHPRSPFRLSPPTPGHHYRDAVLRVEGSTLPLRILMHRGVPENEAHQRTPETAPGNVIKYVALAGAFEPSLAHRDASGPPKWPGRHTGWRWQVQITVATPPPEAPPRQGRSIVLDVGWRVWTAGIRVGMLYDGTHAWELLLPWDMTNRETRRRQAFYAARGQTLETTGSWRDLWAWQTAMDKALDACKAALDMTDHRCWPAKAQALWQSPQRGRARRLRRLRQRLAQADIHLDVLDAWWETYRVEIRRWRACEIRLLRARNHLYRLLAAWLAAHYDVVGLEDLALPDLAEKPTKTRRRRGAAGITTRLTPQQRAERRANKNRHLAGVSILRGYIKEAMEKRGKSLRILDAHYSSCYCQQCGTRLVEGMEAWRVCPEGHVQDRDIGATVELWRRLPPDDQNVGTERPMIKSAQLARSLKPLTLDGFAVPEAHEIPAPVFTTVCEENEDEDVPEGAVPEEVLAGISAK